MKCFYIIGYHGCGKTTQANLLEAVYPNYNYLGGKSGLDAVGSVRELMTLVRQSTSDMIIHGCIFQTEPTIERLARATDLRLIVLYSMPDVVKQRTLARGAKDYNPAKFKTHYSFIKKLPEFKKRYRFRLHVVDNNASIEQVHAELRAICAQS